MATTPYYPSRFTTASIFTRKKIFRTMPYIKSLKITKKFTFKAIISAFREPTVPEWTWTTRVVLVQPRTTTSIKFLREVEKNWKI